jgi:hypothetical protein
MCLLSSFAITLSYVVRQKATLVGRLDERVRLRLAAEAGVKQAIAELAIQEDKGYESLNDTWSNNISAFKNILVGDAICNVYYNYIDGESSSPANIALADGIQ